MKVFRSIKYFLPDFLVIGFVGAYFKDDFIHHPIYSLIFLILVFFAVYRAFSLYKKI